MNNRQLVNRTLGWLFVGTGLVLICYFCVDWPVAVWIHEHAEAATKWLHHTPDFVTGLIIVSPLLLVLIGMRRLWKPWQWWEKILVAVAINILVVAALKYLLKWVFGRPGPMMWFGYGHILTDQSEYVFHWFQGNTDDGLPSGHTAIVCAIAALVWKVWPKWRLLATAAVVAVGFFLVITNFHFVGDTIGGWYVGWLGSLWAMQFSLPWLGLTRDGVPSSALNHGEDLN